MPGLIMLRYFAAFSVPKKNGAKLSKERMWEGGERSESDTGSIAPILQRPSYMLILFQFALLEDACMESILCCLCFD